MTETLDAAASEPKQGPLSGNYRLDGEPRALYWAPYRKRFQELNGILVPGQVMSADSGVDVAFVGNSVLNWTFFDLRTQDREPLGEVFFPGKSAHVDFTASLDPKTDRKKIDLNMVCDAVFGRDKARRNDHLYAARIAEIEAAGYKVLYAPQPNNPLHLRLVHVDQMVDEAPRDVKHTDKEELVKVFRKIK